MSDLKPCPFCGKEPNQKGTELGDRPCFYYECDNPKCGASEMGWHDTEQEAIDAWNNRPVEDALQARIDELEKQVEWHLFDIDNVNTYPPCADMYLTLSIPERTEYREIDDEETYDVLWFELYSEEYWHKHNVTHWAYLPAPPQEEE